MEVGELGVEGTEQKVKRPHGHGQQCGDRGGEGSIKGLNGHEKKRLFIFKSVLGIENSDIETFFHLEV